MRRLVPNTAELILLTRMLTGEPWSVRLFVAAVTIKQSLTLPELIAPSSAWYADAHVGDWTVTAGADQRAYGAAPAMQWTPDADATAMIRGMAFYESDTDQIIALQLFDNPLPIVGGGTIEFVPRFSLFDTGDFNPED